MVIINQNGTDRYIVRSREEGLGLLTKIEDTSALSRKEILKTVSLEGLSVLDTVMVYNCFVNPAKSNILPFGGKEVDCHELAS